LGKDQRYQPQAMLEAVRQAQLHLTLRHGIALDRHVTIMLSQNEDDRPLCGIYFNLHSPFRKKSG